MYVLSGAFCMRPKLQTLCLLKQESRFSWYSSDKKTLPRLVYSPWLGWLKAMSQPGFITGKRQEYWIFDFIKKMQKKLIHKPIQLTISSNLIPFTKHLINGLKYVQIPGIALPKE